MLQAVVHRKRWIAGGLTLQAVGALIPAVALAEKLKHQGTGGHLTVATVKLVWSREAHTHSGIALLIVGAVLVAVGSVLLARPYVHHTWALLVGVPAAAVVGLLLLGAVVLVVALLLMLTTNGGDGGSSNPGSKTRRKEQAPVG